MKTKEHSKPLKRKIIESISHELSNALDVPQSSVRSIIKKLKGNDTCLNLPRADWVTGREEEDWRGTHPDPLDHSEGVKSFSGSAVGDCTYNNWFLTSWSWVGERQREENWPGICPKAPGRLKVLWSDETRMELLGHQWLQNGTTKSWRVICPQENYDLCKALYIATMDLGQGVQTYRLARWGQGGGADIFHRALSVLWCEFAHPCVPPSI